MNNPVEVVITVSGGLVQTVHSTDPSIRITVADYDCDDGCNDLQEQINTEAEELMQRTPMTLVY